MLAYVTTTDPVEMLGLAAVLAGVVVCMPLADAGGNVGKAAFVGAYLCIIGGALLSCRQAIAAGIPDNPEALRGIVRFLLAIVCGILLLGIGNRIVEFLRIASGIHELLTARRSRR